jgi:hypothetical protein
VRISDFAERRRGTVPAEVVEVIEGLVEEYLVGMPNTILC